MPVPQFSTVDQPYLYTMAADTSYYYGYLNSYELRRWPMSGGGFPELLVDFRSWFVANLDATVTGATVKGMWLFDGVLYLAVKPTDGTFANKYYLLKTTTADPTTVVFCTDAGRSGANLQLGWDGSATTSDMYILDKGMIKTTSTIGDIPKGAIVFGEYLAAAIGPTIRVMYSLDGVSFKHIVWFNQGGTNNIKHIHAVWQHPDTGLIYIGTGDADAASHAAIIAWNGVLANWPAAGTGRTPNNLIGSTGFTGWQGLQRYRVINFVYDPRTGYTYTGADQNAPVTERGIWRFSTAGGEYRRVFDHGLSNHNCWSGGFTGSVLYFFTQKEASTGNNWVSLCASTTGAEGDWAEVGRLYMDAANNLDAAIPWHTQLADGRVCVTSANTAVMSSVRSHVIEFSSDVFDSDEPDPIAAIFISTAGTDSVTRASSTDFYGLTPWKPYRTMKYAFVTQKTLSYGIQVRLLAGTYTELQMTAVTWNAFAVGGSSNSLYGSTGHAAPSGTPKVVVRGAGKTQTLVNGDATNNNYLFQLGAATASVHFRNLTLRNNVNSFVLGASDGTTGTITLGRGCRVGDTSDIATRGVFLRDSNTLVTEAGSEIFVNTSANTYYGVRFDTDVASPTSVCDIRPGTVIKAGRVCVEVGGAGMSNVWINGATLLGCDNGFKAINVKTGHPSVTTISIHSNIIKASGGAITNGAGLTFLPYNWSHNCYSVAGDVTHSTDIVATATFVDESAGNYEPTNTNLREAGAFFNRPGTAARLDYAGRKYRAKPTIGAQEYTPVNRPMSGVRLASALRFASIV